MATLNKTKFDAATKGFQTLFNKGLTVVNPLWDLLAMLVPSSTAEEIYNWLGELPQMREWVGERQLRDLKAYDFSVTNKDHELTVGVEVNAIQDDRIGVYAPLMSNMGESVAAYPDKLVFGLLNDGFTAKSYDNVAFFATNHPNGDAGTFSNKATAALSSTSYGAGRASIQGRKNSRGEPLGIRMTKANSILWVPAELEKTGLEILTAEIINNNTNAYRDSAQLVVCPWLTSTTAWFLTVNHQSLKPLIYQLRQKPQFLAKASPSDENVFWEKKVIYGADMRCAAAFGLPQHAYGSTGAG